MKLDYQIRNFLAAQSFKTEADWEMISIFSARYGCKLSVQPSFDNDGLDIQTFISWFNDGFACGEVVQYDDTADDDKKTSNKSDNDDDDDDTEEIPEEDVPLEELPDEDVPLADVPKTGDVSVLWFALSALSGAGLVGLNLTGKKREDEE